LKDLGVVEVGLSNRSCSLLVAAFGRRGSLRIRVIGEIRGSFVDVNAVE
jgi:hypothetical protein